MTAADWPPGKPVPGWAPKKGWEPWEMDGREFVIGPDGWSCAEKVPGGWAPANGAVVKREGRPLALPEPTPEMKQFFPTLTD